MSNICGKIKDESEQCANTIPTLASPIVEVSDMVNSTIHRSYKFRLYPNKEQTARLERSLDLLRQFYNAALQERRDAWEMNRVRISFFDQCKQVPDIRRLNPDYQEVMSRSLAVTLRHLDKSFTAFFRRRKAGERAGYPRFKGPSFFNSIVYNGEGFRFRGDRLVLYLIGEIKIKIHRLIEGSVKEIRVKREGAKWYALVCWVNTLESPLPPTGRSIGIDVGIESFATLSDGTQIDNSKHYESASKDLRVAQRRVARRVKGSNRRKKAVAQLRNIHQKIFNQRHDFQHKVSARLVKAYDLIAVEKLNIKGLSKGTLSKQIFDASWSSFFEKLRYKAANAGRVFVEVNPAYTSQDCSGCGDRIKKALSERVHDCKKCGLVLHRDHNAALNILSAGLADKGIKWAATPNLPLEPTNR